jgi:hypothetical protein
MNIGIEEELKFLTNRAHQKILSFTIIFLHEKPTLKIQCFILFEIGLHHSKKRKNLNQLNKPRSVTVNISYRLFLCIDYDF